jgi:hypothetical protein
METGFDENSHVMKFAAVAKDVKTWQQIQPKLDLQSLRGAGMFFTSCNRNGDPFKLDVSFYIIP